MNCAFTDSDMGVISPNDSDHLMIELDDKPVFIMGCQRSGTNIFKDILGFHPNFSWPSNYLDRFPSISSFAFLSRIYDFPIVGQRIVGYYHRSRFIPKPWEAWHLYKHIDEAFGIICESSPLVSAKLGVASPSIARRFRRIVHLIQQYQGKPRFVAKYTGKPRVKYLNSIFPNALFINIRRDPRAVVSSMYEKVRSMGWFRESWRHWLNAFPRSWSTEISQSFHQVITFLSLYYCHISQRIIDELSEISENRILDINYEDFITYPKVVFREVADFASVEWSSAYADLISKMPLENRNTKYESKLSSMQVAEIDRIVGTYFSMH